MSEFEKYFLNNHKNLDKYYFLRILSLDVMYCNFHFSVI